jgi:hypothetical protein
LLWARHRNDDPKPIIWKVTATEIIDKVQRGRAALTPQINSATDQRTSFTARADWRARTHTDATGSVAGTWRS